MKKTRQYLSLLLAVAFLLSLPPVTANGTAANQSFEAAVAGNSNDYAAYLAQYPAVPAGIDIAVFSDEILLNREDELSLTAEVPAAGLYRLGFSYLAENDSKNALEVAVTVDGAYPFSGLTSLVLPRLWENAGGATTFVEDGNDIRPTLTELLKWQDYLARDSEGYIALPYEIYLTAGVHTLTLHNTGDAFRVKEIVLIGNYDELPDYGAYLDAHAGANRYDGDVITVQAEDFSYVSERTLVAASDMTDPVTFPSDYRYIKLNTLGGSNWRYVGNTAAWTINVPSAGLYRLALRYKQNYYNGISTHRRLTVNGEVPFAEALDLSFRYGTGWQLHSLDERLIYLEAGENTITLEAVLGDNSEILAGLESLIYNLNSLYRKILVITGTAPDVYRDYSLETEIPGLLDMLDTRIADIDTLFTLIEELYQDGGSETATLTQIYYQLIDMREKPSSITKSSRLSRFKSNISSLGTWANKLREQPLELDCLYLTAETENNVKYKAGFIENLVYRLKRFLVSFVTDYSVMGGTGDATRSVRVWVSTGRDQAQLLKNMVEDTFTPEFSIAANVELVSGGLIEAVLAGRGPDVALDRAETDPVNLAMRKALYNLQSFSDFAEVGDRFCAGSLDPFFYQGGYYGLPITQTFDMMFYRIDIFEEYGIMLPETWEDMILYVLPVLNANNMLAGVGQLTDSSIFKILLYQNGGSIYSDDFATATLDSQVAYESFKTAVSFYNDYDLPQTYDFMNRFRTGEMPIAIAPYTMYNNLKLSAPELNGMWEMVCIPGVRDENGLLNNTQIMTATAAVITKNCKDPEAAWTFLKWFLSASVQGRYGNDIESVLGAAGRYNPANMEALSQLSWGAKQLGLLQEQRAVVTTLPNLPGSYFTQRAINNAFVSSVIDSRNPRESLLYWNEEINFELVRKREEFAFDPQK